MFVCNKLRQLLPRAGEILKANPKLGKALTPLMIFQGVSPSQQPNRGITTKTITKSLELVTANASSAKDLKFPSSGTILSPKPMQNLAQPDPKRPLTVLLCWLMSRKKHVLKYAQFYLDQGFDVLVVTTTPGQLLWPTKGTQVAARDVLNFLGHNDQYTTTLLHGFSVGGYLWGEALNIMSQDQKQYQPVIDRISGQIWDSVVDFEGIPVGLPRAVFPKNAILRSSLEAYVRTHMSFFHEVATKHYLASSKNFHNNIVRSPALFLCSLDDPVGTMSGIQRVIDKWESNGIKIYLKAWESSPHVSHLHHHPEEYMQEMKAFLEKLGLVPYPEKFVHRIKSRRAN